jgi:hypothetical protein
MNQIFILGFGALDIPLCFFVRLPSVFPRYLPFVASAIPTVAMYVYSAFLATAGFK